MGQADVSARGSMWMVQLYVASGSQLFQRRRAATLREFGRRHAMRSLAGYPRCKRESSHCRTPCSSTPPSARLHRAGQRKRGRGLQQSVGTERCRARAVLSQLPLPAVQLASMVTNAPRWRQTRSGLYAAVAPSINTPNTTVGRNRQRDLKSGAHNATLSSLCHTCQPTRC